MLPALPHTVRVLAATPAVRQQDTAMAYFLSDDGPEEQSFRGKAKGGFAMPTGGQAPHLGAIDYGETERFAKAAAAPVAYARPTFGKGSVTGAAVRGGEEAAAAFAHEGADETDRFMRRGSTASAADYVRPTFGRGSTQGAQARRGDQAAQVFGHDGADAERFARNHQPGSVQAPLERPQFARKQQIKEESSGMHGIFGETVAASTAPAAQAQAQASPQAGSCPWGTHEEVSDTVHARPTPRGELAVANHDHGAHITATMDAMAAAHAIKTKNSGAGSNIFG